MIALRKDEPCLKNGDYSAVLCGEGCYAYARRFNGETVYVAMNNSGEDMELDIPIYESQGCQIKSLIDGKAYTSADIERDNGYYSGDVHNYESEFKLVLPAYRFDVIKTWRK
jgi:hypothetical protein